MTSAPETRAPVWPRLAWSAVVVAGIVAPAAALLLAKGRDPSAFAAIAAIALTLVLMGTGMIASSISATLSRGLALALMSGAGLFLLATALGLSLPQQPILLVLVALVASVSFAARGALFATSAQGRGWWIALAVVAGEAAIIATAAARPGLLPDWLLVLLPAQWANMAIHSALAGALSRAAIAALIALGSTAAATLLVRVLWPSRWPYFVMFATWLALSALVHQQL